MPQPSARRLPAATHRRHRWQHSEDQKCPATTPEHTTTDRCSNDCHPTPHHTTYLLRRLSRSRSRLRLRLLPCLLAGGGCLPLPLPPPRSRLLPRRSPPLSLLLLRLLRPPLSRSLLLLRPAGGPLLRPDGLSGLRLLLRPGLRLRSLLRLRLRPQPPPPRRRSGLRPLRPPPLSLLRSDSRCSTWRSRCRTRCSRCAGICGSLLRLRERLRLGLRRRRPLLRLRLRERDLDRALPSAALSQPAACARSCASSAWDCIIETCDSRHRGRTASESTSVLHPAAPLMLCTHRPARSVLPLLPRAAAAADLLSAALGQGHTRSLCAALHNSLHQTKELSPDNATLPPARDHSPTPAGCPASAVPSWG